LPRAHILWVRGLTTFSLDDAQEKSSIVITVATINRLVI